MKEESTEGLADLMDFVITRSTDTFATLDSGSTLDATQVEVIFGNDLTEEDLEGEVAPSLKSIDAAAYSTEYQDGSTTYGVFFGALGTASMGQASDSAALHGCGLLTLRAGTSAAELTDEKCPSAFAGWAGTDSSETSLTQTAREHDVNVKINP